MTTTAPPFRPCPFCGVNLRIPAEFSAVRSFKCPKCQRRLSVAPSGQFVPTPTQAEAPFQLVNWYRRFAKPLLERHQSEKVADLDNEAERIETLIQCVDQELAVCFLGSAGVGKSTLINALVAGKETILPAGGIGPLTAQALIVRYGPKHRFEVEYHAPIKLQRLLFALEQSHRRYDQVGAIVASSGIEEQLSQEDRQELTETAKSEAPEERSRIDELWKQARLMVTGKQDGSDETAYLIDCLRLALGKERVGWKAPVRAEDQIRIRAIQEALEWTANGRPVRFFNEEPDRTAFRAVLRDHASGFLAPLIKELRIYWDSPSLKEGVTLVDLPGVGISGDVYQKLTEFWIKEKARAIVVVTEPRGNPSSNAELLRSSGFLNRLLYCASNPEEDPVVLLSAVVKADIIAEANFLDDRNLNGTSARKKAEHFKDVCEQSRLRIKEQMKQELLRAWSSQNPEIGAAQQKVIEGIIDSMQVHTVSALQYRKLLLEDEEDRPFITDAEQSNIPEMSRSLQQLASIRRGERTSKLQEAADDFFKRVYTTLKLIHARWTDEDRASKEAEELSEKLKIFLEPLRREFENRQGAFREFLKSTMPAEIEKLVEKARSISKTEIVAYLEKLNDAHWATLKAAVKYEGVFHGARRINLPAEFALRFEEPIAEAWEKSILSLLRKRTRELSQDYIALVDRIIGWVQETKEAQVKAELVKALRDQIESDAKSLTSMGRDVINELREEVKNKLAPQIEASIRRRCKAFVEKNQHIGAGVKLRILNLFGQLAEQATEAACKPAIEVITACFRKVEKEILAVFQRHPDPLKTAAEAIVASEEQRAKRSDAQRRKKVLAELEAAFGACPLPEPAVALAILGGANGQSPST